MRAAFRPGITRSMSSMSASRTAASIKANCRKVVCIGRNYADHITELNNQRPKQPFYFLKPPSSILLPGEGSVIRPKGVSLHYEVELGVVIGREVRDLDAEDEKGAMDAIDCYLTTIDLTARNVQNEAKSKGLPWSIAKGFDTFLPISNPVPLERLKHPDPYGSELFLSVNDNVRQKDTAELMLFRIPRLISDISKVMKLEAGDLVLTGTPKGVGEVKAGDVMKAGIRVNGEEVTEAGIDVKVEDGKGKYEYAET